ncbi:glycosyltransferase involved in cell wall biosynthesis [Azospirillum lipoferum]|uniref:Glycosyltransferase n=1 Tax=Azospirillum lipoferum TaxID=193 RepID=A0A5A9GH89_AZOLI|nr:MULTISPECIES: glycosyltransferase [Azospirillum]KAA0593697.1 glycosyltransferase [Azospirillum lipoferum]MCP1615042.1 glycosyltransferase involved in cell wall biosynthesis [Azospirillum lipoferum]MDW5536947.1 glycosyltransferase [Azospirillum sp. NL1]
MTLSISLLLYVEAAGCRAPGGVVAFCHPEDLSQLRGLPNLRACVVPGGHPAPHPATGDAISFPWLTDEAWGDGPWAEATGGDGADRNTLPPLLAEGERIELLFLCRQSAIPSAAILRLARFGHKTVTAIVGGAPVVVRCDENRARRRRLIDEAVHRFCVDSVRKHPLGKAGGYHPEGGHGFSAYCPSLAARADTNGKEGRSRLVLLEDGRPLGSAHALHTALRGVGRGLYSHWESRVFFSSSDNSNPNENGRAYSWIELPEHPTGMERRLARISGVLPSGDSAWSTADLEVEDRGQARRLPSLRPAERVFEEWLERDGGRLLPPEPSERRILLMIGYLGPGGAERQICNLARGLLAQEYAPSLMTMSPIRDEGRHYADMLLHDSDIPILSLDTMTHGDFIQATGDEEFRRILWAAAPTLRRLPEEVRLPVIEAMIQMHRLRPAAVICYLDMVNVVGGLAALLVGVPRILLSGRNVNPTHFPNLYRPWFHGLYRMLLRSPRVVMSANAEAGARSYATWLMLKPETVKVIVNGIAVEDLPQPTLAQRVETRLSVGVGSSRPLIVGVFRLAPEKQPLLFVEVIARIRREIPHIKAVIAGIGPLREAMERRLRALGIEDAIHFLGRSQSVNVLLGAADLLLHTAKAEGLPNVIMEAQWQALPVVCTCAGGTPSALSPSLLSYMHEIDDLDGLTRSCLFMLRNHEERRRLAAEAQADVHRRFTVEALVERTLDVLAPPPPTIATATATSPVTSPVPASAPAPAPAPARPLETAMVRAVPSAPQHKARPASIPAAQRPSQRKKRRR